MLLPLSLVTLHLFIGEQTAYSLTPNLDVTLNTEQASPRQGRQVQFQAALVFRNRERAAIREVTLSVRGPRSFDANLPLVEGAFDLSGIRGVVGTLTGNVSTNGVAAPLPFLYKSNSTGGAILIDYISFDSKDPSVAAASRANLRRNLEDQLDENLPLLTGPNPPKTEVGDTSPVAGVLDMTRQRNGYSLWQEIRSKERHGR